MPHWRLGGEYPAVVYVRGDGGPGVSLELLTVTVATGVVAALARPPSTLLSPSRAVGGELAALHPVYPTAYLTYWEVAYPSRDGRRYVWWSDNDVNADRKGVVGLDLGTAPPTVLGVLTTWPSTRGPVLAARITPGGGAVLVQFEFAGVYVYDAALSVGQRVMATRLLKDDAADVMVASGSGHDTLEAINDDQAAEDGGWVVAVDLVTLDKYALFPVPRDDGTRDGRPRVAVTGQAYDRPGWVVLSADQCDAGAAGDWLCGKVVAMEVATRQVVPLATTYPCAGGAYGRRRQLPAAAATPNLDLSRVYFTIAGRGRCQGYMELYELTTAGRFGEVAGEGGRAEPPPSRRPPGVPSQPEVFGGGSSSSLPTTNGLNVGIAI
eukprot:contig_21709_g5361